MATNPRAGGPTPTTTNVAALAMIAALVSAGCGGGAAHVGPSGAPSVDFAQRGALAVSFHTDAAGELTTDGGATSLQIENRSRRPVRVTRVEPIADSGLKASYLGYTTTCARGCAGAVRWSREDAELTRKSLGGVLPITLLPNSQLRAQGQELARLVFRLEVPREGIDRVRRRCLLLRSVRLTLPGGEHIVVNGFANRPVYGVWAEDHALPGAAGCDGPMGWASQRGSSKSMSASKASRSPPYAKMPPGRRRP